MSDDHGQPHNQPTDRSEDRSHERAEDSATASVDLDARPERVWEALTEEQGLAPWMGEGASVEARPGGLVRMPDPVGGVTRRGRVDRVEPGQRLDFTWWPALRPADQTEVSITVEARPSGTRVTVVERPVPLVGRSRPVARAMAASPANPARQRPAPVGVRPSLLSRTVGPTLLMTGAWAWRLAALTLASAGVTV